MEIAPLFIFAKACLCAEGWAQNVLIDIDASGRIASVQSDSGCPENTMQVSVLLPAPINAHSHGFQRAMAGLTEARGPTGTDSFWTWRSLMYRFLDQLDPDDVEAITAFVHMEMLEAGYGGSVEFHYLHHQPGGAPYAALGEMSERVCAAAATSGIGLTLLPVLYQYGGCDQRPLGPGQCRFGNDLDLFAQLLDHAGKSIAQLPQDAVLGVAPHSLRAVAQLDLKEIAHLRPQSPVHMHLAEQLAEVDEVLHHWHARPVEWALDNLDLDARWCLIHCTQMTDFETTSLAATGAIAGLCPTTEASLGDGIFNGVAWLGAGGRLAIGSDSNIRISLAEELRQLDYSQRLRDRSRAALATADTSTGRRIFDAACAGGAQAAGRKTGRIETGAWADLMALNADHVTLAARTADQVLDSFVFAGGSRMVTDVWSAGRHLVQYGRHLHRDSIESAYRDVLNRLSGAL
ncbi:MAG: formimidoylglutamate deiminase [Pseudomonadota bacterium]